MRRRLHNDDWGYESNCYVCEARNEGGLQIPFFHDLENDVVEADFLLDSTYSGAPTMVHGGVQLAVLDEAMAWATIAIAGQWALTSKSSAEFLAPVMVDVRHQVDARIGAVDGTRITAAACIINGDGVVCTTAAAEFVAIGEAVATTALGTAVKDEHRGFLRDGGQG